MQFSEAQVLKGTKSRWVGLRSDTGLNHHSLELWGGIRAVLCYLHTSGPGKYHAHVGVQLRDEGLCSDTAEEGCGEWLGRGWCEYKEEGGGSKTPRCLREGTVGGKMSLGGGSGWHESHPGGAEGLQAKSHCHSLNDAFVKLS